jgi:hypothetical protein
LFYSSCSLIFSSREGIPGSQQAQQLSSSFSFRRDAASFILSGDNLTLDTRLRGLFATQSGNSLHRGCVL